LLRVKCSVLIFLVLLVEIVAGQQTNLTPHQYEEDFDYLWRSVSEDYAYFDQKQTDWTKVREIYRPQITAVKTRSDFVRLLESVLEELYDFHTHLNTNTPTSPRLVPSGTDIWADWIKQRAVITEIRPESPAAKAGLKAGMQIALINGIAVEEAVGRRLGKSLRARDEAARNWALRSLLAGRHNEKRSIEVVSNNGRRLISIEGPGHQSDENKPLIDHRVLEKGIGYIRVNNSLGDTDLIKQFDLALAGLKHTR